MINVGTKVNWVSGTPTSNMYEAVNEYNDKNTELQGAVTASGQVLNSLVSNQLSKALFINGIAARSFVENSPAANVANLTPYTGASGLVVPDAYAQMHGALVAFNHSVSSTTNSTTGFTVNFGQTTLLYLGNQYLTNPDGSAIAVGAVYGYTVIRYNLSNTRWELVQSQGLGILSLAGAYTMIDGAGPNFINMTTASNTYAVTLPAAANNIGRIITLSKIDSGSGSLTVNPFIGDSIEGLTTVSVPVQYQALTVRSNGTTWVIVSLKNQYDGLQEYIGGQTYNSVALTVTPPTGGANTRSVFMPYQTLDGTWRLKFNIACSMTLSTVGTIAIAGVTFKNVSNYFQAVAACPTNGAAFGSGSVSPNTNTITFTLSGNTAAIYISGDVELDSKPTWAN